MIHGSQIGFSQRIRLEWLEFTANLVLAKSPRGEIIAALHDRLWDKLSVGSESKRGNRDKAITILTRVWSSVPKEMQPVRDEGLGLLQRLSKNDEMIVHWCMCIAAYPFFGAVADVTGRLLQLQEVVGAAQVQRRIREQVGDRETVTRAVRRMLRVFIDWGALVETEKKGFYRLAPKRSIHDLPLSIWIISAALASNKPSSRPRSASFLLRGPHLFPFEVVLPTIVDLEAHSTLDVARFGPNREVLVSQSGLSS